VFVSTKKTAAGTVVHVLVENRYEGSKTRQKALYYLGKAATPQDRLDALTQAIEAHRAKAEAYRRERRTWVDDALATVCDIQADECERRRRRLLAVLADGGKRKGKGGEAEGRLT
jgi:hypothetical protein